MTIKNKLTIPIIIFMTSIPLIEMTFTPHHKVEQTYNIQAYTIEEENDDVEMIAETEIIPLQSIMLSNCSYLEKLANDILNEPVKNEPTTEAEPVKETEEEYQSYISEDEIDLIARVVMAEAEEQCEEGKRLVVDTILNRIDSEYFPNSVDGVIYQPEQYACMWNGRIDICPVRDDIRELVIEEAKSRYNEEVIYFRTKHFFDFGTPMFQVGDHYFSKED